MNNLRKSFLLLLILLTTAACSLFSSKTETPVPGAPEVQKTIMEAATDTVQPSSPALTSTESPSTDSSQYIPPCASPTETETLYILDEPSLPFGVCFLYPSDFTVTKSQVPNIWYFTGTPYGSGEMVSGTIEMQIGSADGKMLEQYAADAAAAAAPGMNTGLNMIFLMPDEVPAMKTEALPGLVSSRTIYVVHDNTALTFTFTPLDQGFQEAWLDMERAYALFNNTFVLIE